MDRRRTTGLGCGTAAAVVLAAAWLLATAPVAGAADAPLAAVSLEHVADASVSGHTDACANTSSAALGIGEVRVRRTGPTTDPLAVHYSVQASAPDDLAPLAGDVTIPAGAASASIPVSIRFADGPPPVHAQRTSTVTLTLANDAAYSIATPSATVTLAIDVDRDSCPPPATVTPATSPPARPATKPVAARRRVTPATADPPAGAATLPFTGGPLTEVLAGSGTALVALGSMGVRYGRSRARRTRARRRSPV